MEKNGREKEIREGVREREGTEREGKKAREREREKGWGGKTERWGLGD